MLKMSALARRHPDLRSVFCSTQTSTVVAQNNGRLNMFVGSGRVVCWGRRSWSNVCSGPIFGAATVLLLYYLDYLYTLFPLLLQHSESARRFKCGRRVARVLAKQSGRESRRYVSMERAW